MDGVTYSAPKVCSPWLLHWKKYLLWYFITLLSSGMYCISKYMVESVHILFMYLILYLIVIVNMNKDYLF